MFKQHKVTKGSDQRPKGITYFQHFPANFITPYGEAKDLPDDVSLLKRVTPRNCEWLNRPETGMSEMAVTIDEHLELLSKIKVTLVNTEQFINLQQTSAPFIQSLKRLNKFNKLSPAKNDIKEVLKQLYSDGSELDGARPCLVCMAKKLQGYANKLTSTDMAATVLKKEATMKGLKTYLTTLCTGNDNAPTREPMAGSCVALVDLLESSDDDNDVSMPPRGKTKKVPPTQLVELNSESDTNSDMDSESDTDSDIDSDDDKTPLPHAPPQKKSIPTPLKQRTNKAPAVHTTTPQEKTPKKRDNVTTIPLKEKVKKASTQEGKAEGETAKNRQHSRPKAKKRKHKVTEPQVEEKKNKNKKSKKHE